MKKITLFIIVCLPLFSYGQIGLKAGLNFANVTNASSLNNSSQTGFHAGILLAPASKKVLSSRTELLFSRQGYNYKSSSNTGTVNLNYIMLQQGMCINITRFFSLFGGAQTAYLISAKVDSSQTNGNNNPYGGQLMSLYNRMDYGIGVGAEVHPVSGLLIGVKYNISLGKIYNSVEAGQSPSFSANDLKNNVVQLSVGWIFGNKQSKKK